MTFEDILDVVKRIRYKGKKPVTNVRAVKFSHEDHDLGFDIMVTIDVKNRTTDEDDRLYTHYTYSPEEMKYLEPSNIVRRVRSMLIYLETHEVDEQLLYKDRRVFDPHGEKLTGPNIKREKLNYKEQIAATKTAIIKQLKEREVEHELP